MAYKKGELLAEGKTKRIYAEKDISKAVIVFSKDDITAGDGKKHDTIKDKGVMSTTTTSNVFRLLNACGVRTAFIERISPVEFLAYRCEMIDLEVIVRREGHGSHLKRNPHHEKGRLFPKLRVEFYLKTSDKKWGEYELPKDDPLIQFVKNNEGIIDGMHLFRPDSPIALQEPFLKLPFSFKWDQKVLEELEDRARTIFLILERAWFLEGRKLVDFKVEFGFTQDRKLVLADVVDNDSWRLVENGEYQDKEVYRQGGDLNEVARKLRRVAEATNRFRLPRQRIILWSGSSKDVKPDDKDSPWNEIMSEHGHQIDCELMYHMRSAHKQPAQAFRELQEWVHGSLERFGVSCTNTVIIAYVGMSNGLGPMLAANTHVPVITCSASAGDFPDDVWSGLRTPSLVPPLFVLSPKNALLAAIRILSAGSPRLYALVRKEIESRMEDEE